MKKIKRVVVGVGYPGWVGPQHNLDKGDEMWLCRSAGGNKRAPLYFKGWAKLGVNVPKVRVVLEIL